MQTAKKDEIMRLLVCGGRTYSNKAFLFKVLTDIHNKKPIIEIIHGAAKGADSLAGEWARETGIKETAVPADWDRYHKRAGSIRNQEMAEMKPDLVVAFPGGNGTADMCWRAKEMNLKILDLRE